MSKKKTDLYSYQHTLILFNAKIKTQNHLHRFLDFHFSNTYTSGVLFCAESKIHKQQAVGDSYSLQKSTPQTPIKKQTKQTSDANAENVYSAYEILRFTRFDSFTHLSHDNKTTNSQKLTNNIPRNVALLHSISTLSKICNKDTNQTLILREKINYKNTQ